MGHSASGTSMSSPHPPGRKQGVLDDDQHKPAGPQILARRRVDEAVLGDVHRAGHEGAGEVSDQGHAGRDFGLRQELHAVDGLPGRARVCVHGLVGAGEG